MSKVAPHNSYIKFEKKDGKYVAVKYYQKYSKYSAEEESRAYSAIQILLSQVKGIRTVRVLNLDKKDNTLILEYIPGLSLFEKVKNGEVACLDSNMVALINLFIAARNNEVHFDSDPSNIMFDDTGIVLIDPVCTDLPIKDYSFVVFMWGLIKIVLRNGKIWRAGEVITRWNIYLIEYCNRTNTSKKNINTQLVEYIDLVVSWNKKKNEVESWFIYLFRFIVVIPVYISVRHYFSRNKIE